MIFRPNCDYCGKEISKKSMIRLHIEDEIDGPTLILDAEFCSDECLEKALDLGSKILDQGCAPEKYFKELEDE